MGIVDMLKKNLRLVIFFGGIVILAIYLFATTKMETKDTTTQQPTTTQSSEATNTSSAAEEGTTDDSTADSGEEPVVEVDTEGVQKESRPSKITQDVTEIEGHQLLTENNRFQLFLQENNLSLILREKKTGAVMYSTVASPQGANESWSSFMKSPVVVNYITETNTGFNQLDMETGNPEIALKKGADGFSAQLTWPEQELSFLMEVSLTETGVTVKVPDDSIEEKSDKYTIGELYLYPFMGYSLMDAEEGYMFLPDGSGTLIDLHDNQGQFSQPFSQPLYGQDLGVEVPRLVSTVDDRLMSNEASKLSAPIFGVVHTKKGLGYLAVIESGDANATLEAYPNGAILPYNWATAKFTYRSVYAQATSRDSGTMMMLQKNRNEVNAQISYRFVSDEQADYVGLAASYRQYLLDNQLINTTEDNSLMRVDFFGADNENSLVTKKMLEMTTFEQMDDIISDLQKSQLDRLSLGIKGWQAGGAFAGYSQDSLQAEKGLGGNSELTALLDKYQEDYSIHLYNDGLRFNPDTLNSSKFDLFTRLNKQLYEEATYGPVYPQINYLTPEQSQKNMTSFLQTTDFADNTGLTVAGITDEIFSYSKDGKTYDRAHAMATYGNLLETAAKASSLELETPFQAYWHYADVLTQMPIRSSNYVFETQEIPFFGLALRGLVSMYAPYLNFEANRDEYLLKILESGIKPAVLVTEEDSRELRNSNSSDIYTSKYSTFQKEIVDIYQQIEAVQQELGDAEIIDHARTGNQVKVKYDNGSSLLLNFSNQTVNFEGEELEAYGYKVVK